MKHVLALAVLFFVASTTAQTVSSKDVPIVKGKFYYKLDDEAQIFINGVELVKFRRGDGQSDEVSLKPGDRMTIQLKNVAGEKFFRVLFVASDRSTMLPFTRQIFKCLPDPEQKDFKEADWQAAPKFAKEIRDKDIETFPFKSRADYIWGDADFCAIGAVLKREMFVAVPKK